MNATRPRVWVSQPLRTFASALDTLSSYCDVEVSQTVKRYTQAEVISYLADKEGALLTCSEHINAAVLAQTPRLRAISNLAVGYNNLDLVALRQSNIIATHTPDVLTEATADLGFALLLATARRLNDADRWIRQGQWQTVDLEAHLGVAVHGRCLGILGMGRIGQAIANRGHFGFGMPIYYHNRQPLPTSVERRWQATYVDFETLLTQADHLVLTLPYSPECHLLINAAALAKMRPTATLINIARGNIVDENALAQCLASGHLAGAGLDVFADEPNVPQALCALPNVVLTPHIGSAVQDTRQTMVELAITNLVSALGLGPQAHHPPCVIGTAMTGQGQAALSIEA